MKRIGIVTHYYHSNNYGGNLQAYALVTYINKLSGFTAEQICYSFIKTSSKKVKSKKSLIDCISRYNIKFQCFKFIDYLYSNKYKLRLKSIRKFNKAIPHSSSVFFESTISECINNYDCFITGSDQVWSGNSNTFFLGFVHGKPKLSFSANIGLKEISNNHKQFIEEKLRDFTAISVRNENDKRIISELTEKDIQIIFDPVFLLSPFDWNRIAQDAPKKYKKYIFCYFLGDTKKFKDIAKRFAKKMNLKIVTIANYKDNENRLIKNDLFYGDYKPYDVSPADFVGLIRDAEYVFTDSFHAVAFSLIYHKQFFVFDRISKYGDMSARIVNILNQFNLSDRFCKGEEKESVNYLLGLADIDYKEPDNILSSELKRSQDFLIENIK